MAKGNGANYKTEVDEWAMQNSDTVFVRMNIMGLGSKALSEYLFVLTPQNNEATQYDVDAYVLGSRGGMVQCPFFPNDRTIDGIVSQARLSLEQRGCLPAPVRQTTALCKK